ncbi:MAG: hypothetical protein M3406_14730 [Chloroflexota bacterium]|nr:hypothetical protein [Chloroflexota bacterium]
MTRDRLGLLLALPLALIAYFLIANGVADTPEERAEAAAHDYLAAACEADDRGWSMLVADQRIAEFASREHYLGVADESDCAGFDWHVIETDCHDVGACVVWLSVSDEASIPEYLVESGIVSYRTDKVPTGANAGMAVLQNGVFGHGVIVPKG